MNLCRILPYVSTDETGTVWWKLLELQAGFKGRHERTDYTRRSLYAGQPRVQNKKPVNISYNDFLLRLLRGELAGMTVVSSITGSHIRRLFWGVRAEFVIQQDTLQDDGYYH